MFDISVFVSTPIIGKIGSKYNKKSFIACGYGLCLISSSAFAFLDNDFEEYAEFCVHTILVTPSLCWLSFYDFCRGLEMPWQSMQVRNGLFDKNPKSI